MVCTFVLRTAGLVLEGIRLGRWRQCVRIRQLHFSAMAAVQLQRCRFHMALLRSTWVVGGRSSSRSSWWVGGVLASWVLNLGLEGGVSCRANLCTSTLLRHVNAQNTNHGSLDLVVSTP